MFRERHLTVGPVDRAGGGIDKVLDAVVAAAFQDMQEAGDVAGDVDVGVLGGVADAGLGCEVYDALGFMLAEGGFHGNAIG